MKKKFTRPSMKAIKLNIEQLLVGSQQYPGTEQIPVTDKPGPSKAKAFNPVKNNNGYDY